MQLSLINHFFTGFLLLRSVGALEVGTAGEPNCSGVFVPRSLQQGWIICTCEELRANTPLGRAAF